MSKFFYRSLALACLFFSLDTLSAPKHKKTKPPKKPIKIEQKTEKKTVSVLAIKEEPQVVRFKYASIGGVEILRGEAGLVMGGQLGLLSSQTKAFYIGPEVGIAYFAPGAILHTTVNAWFESSLGKDQKFMIIYGIGLGLGYSSDFPLLSAKTALIVFGDLCVSQTLDELVSIRGHIRPGLIGRFLNTTLDVSVSFAFS